MEDDGVGVGTVYLEGVVLGQLLATLHALLTDDATATTPACDLSILDQLTKCVQIRFCYVGFCF